MSADILIYAIVAAGLVFWLRNVLGTRHGDERERPNPFTAPPPEKKGKDAAASAIVAAAAVLPGESENWRESLDKNMDVIGEDTEKGLLVIAQADHSFELLHFLRGAQDAFAMIIEAFAAGEKGLLKNLLFPSVYEAFEAVIADRAAKKQTASAEIHAIRKAEIIEATLEGHDVAVTVRFVADETNVLRDEMGEILSGNPDRVSETIDIWTFSRNVKSKDPTWRVMRTRDEDANDHDHKTVPDHD